MQWNNTNYFSFLLRLWQEHREGQLIWRASLEDPRDGERLGFKGIEELLMYLTQVTQGGTSQKDENPQPPN